MKQKTKLFLAKYFCSIEGFLFWLGGVISIVWCIAMYAVAHGLHYPGRELNEPGFGWTLTYISALMFVLGVKGSRRNLNGHTRYPGELWAVLVIINTFLIFFEYYTPFQLCPIGPAVKDPSQLVPSTLGVMAIFGAVRYIKIGALIRSAAKQLIDRLKVL